MNSRHTMPVGEIPARLSYPFGSLTGCDCPGCQTIRGLARAKLLDLLVARLLSLPL